MARTPGEIAIMLDRLQGYFAAVTTGILLLNDEAALQLLSRNGYDPGARVRLGRSDNSYYEGIPFWDSIRAVRGNSGFNLDYLGSQLMTILTWVGDELSRNNYFDRTPELEFFRHLRNAVSHGNLFHFAKGEPKRPARFKGFEITPALHGRAFLFEYMGAGDLFDLFDHVKAHLRTLEWANQGSVAAPQGGRPEAAEG